MTKTPTVGSEKGRWELHCDSPCSSLAVSRSQWDKFSTNNGPRGCYSGSGLPSQSHVRTKSAADRQHQVHAALPCLAVTLKHWSHVAELRWSQEQTPSLLVPRSCFCPADSHAPSCPAPVWRAPKGLEHLLGKGKALPKQRAAMWSNPADDMWAGASSHSPQMLTSVSFDLPVLSFQNIKNTNIYQQD